MYKNQSQKINNFKKIIKIIPHLAYIVAILLLAYNLNFVRNELEFQNKQSLFFNARTNNVRECLKNQDFSCPDNKYVNTRQFTADDAN